MLTTSRPFPFFDYFRIPYRMQPVTGLSPGLPPFVAQVAAGRADGTERRLLWLVADECAAERYPAGFYHLGDITLVGRVAPDAEARRWLTSTGTQWVPAESVRDPDGRRVASVWRSPEGDVFLPFDPGQVMHLLWSEGYRRV